MARPLNVGLVGGGKGAFIVHPHQKAIHFDGTRRVVAGALFPDPKIAMEEAAKWPYPTKGYGSYDEMIAANAALPGDQKLDYILIVTPNFVHFDPAMKAMKAGIAVFCEKPLCLNLKEADDLVKTARKLGVPFGLMHTSLDHWTSRLGRFIVEGGWLGEEAAGGRQGPWAGRTDSGWWRWQISQVAQNWAGWIGKWNLLGDRGWKRAGEDEGEFWRDDGIPEVRWRWLARWRAWWQEWSGAWLRPGLAGSGQMGGVPI